MERAGRPAYLYREPVLGHPDVREPEGLQPQILLHGESVFRLLLGERVLWHVIYPATPRTIVMLRQPTQKRVS